MHCSLAQRYSICPVAQIFLIPLPKVHFFPTASVRIEQKTKADRLWHTVCSQKNQMRPGGGMVSVHIENLGALAIVECEGRIVSSHAAFTLRNAVTSQTNAA